MDFFAGIGGFRIALDRLGGRCVFASETDRFARQCYFQNFNDLPAGDVSKEDRDIFYSPPRSTSWGLSMSKFQRIRPEERSRGRPGKVVPAERPDVLLLDNVRGLMAHNDGMTLEVILSDLEGKGYS